jgi:hypothetical protein
MSANRIPSAGFVCALGYLLWTVPGFGAKK